MKNTALNITILILLLVGCSLKNPTSSDNSQIKNIMENNSLPLYELIYFVRLRINDCTYGKTIGCSEASMALERIRITASNRFLLIQDNGITDEKINYNISYAQKYLLDCSKGDTKSCFETNAVLDNLNSMINKVNPNQSLK